MRPMLIVACGIGTLGVLLFIRMLCYYKNEIRRPLLKIQEFMACVPDIHARILIDTDEKNELLDMMLMLNEMLGSLEHKNEELVQSQTQMLEEKQFVSRWNWQHTGIRLILIFFIIPSIVSVESR